MNNNRLKMLDEVSEEFHRFDGASHAASEETWANKRARRACHILEKKCERCVPYCHVRSRQGLWY